MSRALRDPHSSVSKESACNAGDPGSIPGLGRSPGGGIGYPLHYSCASLVSQTVKNPPAMWETWVQSLGWEDPLEEGMATHSTILVWRIPMDRGTWWLQSMGSQGARHDRATLHLHSLTTLLTKARLVKARVFPVVMYGWETWSIKKAEY